MLKVAVVDANEKANKAYVGMTNSVVGQWLKWEMDRVGVPDSPKDQADILPGWRDVRPGARCRLAGRSPG